jgi:phosphatidylglycerophosphate synthase
MSKFRELLRSTYKSRDTEENIDIYFTRPIGLIFALFFKKAGWSPNAVTILSYFIGGGAAWMFHYADVMHNVWGVLLLMTANFLDSADGQLARMTGKKSITGRILDGFATEFWFICIYIALTWRLWDVSIPFTQTPWRGWFFLLCCIAGFGAHNFQCRMADYYRNIHLYFLNGREGAELDTYESQHDVYEHYKAERNLTGMLFFANYAAYCRKQELSTPHFQRLRQALIQRYGSIDNVPQQWREDFCRMSRPLMKYTNIVSYNWRAIVLYIGCLCNVPWISPVFEITVLMLIAKYMQHRHENICRELYEGLPL